jgi:eukaryotic-like serine/threonine-protein kinase
MIHPERLGKYEIRSVLGKGAMGIVYKAFDPHIERFVAIKTIRKDTVEPELAAQYMARFKNEAKAAGRLQHPNIVSVYEYGEDDKVTFIAMEYVEGAGLREYLNRRASFDFGQLAALMEQLLDALEFAHARGVVHRDIKPSNLIITNAAQLKVADFGIARVDTSNLTMVGMTIGTPPYMSPEQIRGFEVDHRSDLFSTGIVLYELLTGERPFGGNLESVTYKICHDDPEPPSKRSALKLPVEVDHLVAKALAKEPEARFQDARSFHDELREVARMSVQVDDGSGTTLVNIGTLMLGKPAPAWDEETLRTAEHELARVLGPMAKLIVRKAAAKTSDRVELCSILADNIVDLEMRRKFVDAFNQTSSGVRRGTGGRSAAATGGSAGGGTHPSGPSRPVTASKPGTAQTAATQLAAAPLDQAFIDQITARLAVYIGPIAPILAKRAARDAKSRGDFLHRVADNLGTQERAAFLREVGLADD